MSSPQNDLILKMIYGFTLNMIYSVDFGGSTIDVVSWEKGKVQKIRSFERYPKYKSVKPVKFLESQKQLFRNAEIIYVTGGKSRSLPANFSGIPLEKVNEIEAIGRGGYMLFQDAVPARERQKIIRLLVVSMGTGTCMVEVRMGTKGYLGSRHVGGTGVGGGTFMGLAKQLLGETTPAELKKMFARGDKGKVDLSVYDIVGGGIGIVPAEATAANLARISREIRFTKNDLAAGIVNLIGQTIGILAVFAARAHKCDLVVLTGKLTEMEQVTESVLYTGKMYKVKMCVPGQAGYVAAFGAGAFQSPV